jgi:tetratricopeptide (TPR) repeat protein
MVLPFLAACSAVSPDPATASIEELSVVSLTAEQSAACARLEEQAVDAVARGLYAEAGAFANQALATNPRLARARAVLGMVKLQQAASEQPSNWFALRSGEVEMELARQLDPNSAFVGWMHAVFLAEAGHMSAAAVAAEDALVRSVGAAANERAALLGIAGSYRYELGEERAARPHLEAYVALRPGDAMAHFRLGSSLLSIAKTPQGSPPPYLRAQGEAEAAARSFARCFELAPDDEGAALAVSTALLRAAELAVLQDAPEKLVERDELYGKAAKQLQKVAEQFPDSAEVHFRMGVVASLQDQVEVAKASYQAALQRDEYHLGSMLNLASLLVAGGELDAAAALFGRVLAAPGGSSELTTSERARIEQWLSQRPSMSTDAASASAGDAASANGG